MDDFTDLTTHEHLIRDTLEIAMAGHLLVSISYQDEDGYREVEPHAIGWTIAGNACARVYQVRGFSNDMDTEGWRMIELAKVKQAVLLDEHVSLGVPREKYRMNDRGMVRIHKQYDLEGKVVS